MQNGRQPLLHDPQKGRLAVIDPQGQLVCFTVYKRVAVEVVRRLAA